MALLKEQQIKHQETWESPQGLLTAQSNQSKRLANMQNEGIELEPLGYF